MPDDLDQMWAQFKGEGLAPAATEKPSFDDMWARFKAGTLTAPEPGSLEMYAAVEQAGQQGAQRYQQQQQAKDVQQSAQYLQTNFGEGLDRSVRVGYESAKNSLIGGATRIASILNPGDTEAPAMAEYFTRQNDTNRRALELANEKNWVPKAITNGVERVSSAVIQGATASPATTFGVDAYNSSLTEAEDAGLTGGKKQGYALTQAAIASLTAHLFHNLGAAGAEQAIPAATFKAGVKQWAQQSANSFRELGAMALAGRLTDRLYDVKGPVQWHEIPDILGSAAMDSGMLAGLGAVSRQLTPQQVVERLQANPEAAAAYLNSEEGRKPAGRKNAEEAGKILGEPLPKMPDEMRQQVAEKLQQEPAPQGPSMADVGPPAPVRDAAGNVVNTAPAKFDEAGNIIQEPEARSPQQAPAQADAANAQQPAGAAPSLMPPEATSRPEGEKTAPGVENASTGEQRANMPLRARIDALAPENRAALLKDVERLPPEQRQAHIERLMQSVYEAHQDPVTGLPTRRAFLEAEKKGEIGPWKLAMDNIGQGGQNDLIDYALGDATLKADADASRAHKLDLSRWGGDEFMGHGDNPKELKAKADRMNEFLKDKEIEITATDGTVRTFKGARMVFGIGRTTQEALAHMEFAKGEASANGVRPPKGQLPGYLVEKVKGQYGPPRRSNQSEGQAGPRIKPEPRFYGGTEPFESAPEHAAPAEPAAEPSKVKYKNGKKKQGIAAGVETKSNPGAVQEGLDRGLSLEQARQEAARTPEAKTVGTRVEAPNKPVIGKGGVKNAHDLAEAQKQYVVAQDAHETILDAQDAMDSSENPVELLGHAEKLEKTADLIREDRKSYKTLNPEGMDALAEKLRKEAARLENEREARYRGKPAPPPPEENAGLKEHNARVAKSAAADREALTKQTNAAEQKANAEAAQENTRKFKALQPELPQAKTRAVSAWEGNRIEGENKSFVTDGRALISKSVMSEKHVKQFEGKDGDKTRRASPAGIKQIWDGAIERNTSKGTVLGFLDAAEVSPDTKAAREKAARGEKLTRSEISDTQAHGAVLVENEKGQTAYFAADKWKMLKDVTGFDAVKLHPEEAQTRPAVFYKKGKPVAVLMPFDPGYGAAGYEIDVRAAREAVLKERSASGPLIPPEKIVNKEMRLGSYIPMPPDITHAVGEVAESIKAIKDFLSPASASEEAGKTAGIVRAQTGLLARKMAVAEESMRKVGKFFDGQKPIDNYAFMMKVEHGVAQPSPELQSIADALRTLLDSARSDVQALGTGKLESFIENYFPHIWKDPQKAQEVMRSIMSKKPLEGPKNFLKRRVHADIESGLKAGLEPVSDNPVTLALLKVREMQRYVMAQKIMQEMKSKGLAAYVKAGQKAPDGYARIDDKVATVFAPPHEGAIGIRGQYYAPKDAARVLNNYLSPGLRGNAAYDSYRFVGNVLNQAQLGFSFFHLGFVSGDAIVSQNALGLRQLSDGKPLASLRSFAEAPIAPITSYFRGSQLMREYLTNPNSPIARAVAQSGGRIGMDSFYKNSSVESFWNALHEGRPAGAAVHGLPMLLEYAARPVMEHFVPRMKLGAFARLAEYELSRLGPDASEAEVRKAMQDAWDSVDNRMGQLVYDNLFWNKTLKDALMGSVRSVGWNLGTIRELGGGTLDFLHAGKELATGHKAELSNRAAYLIALPFTAAVAGAITQYLFTGQGPQTLKDCYFPRTGRKDDDGNEERVQLPTYMKDVMAYLRHPLQTLEHKLHPEIGMIADMLNNKDYYEHQIRNPDDPAVKQVQDLATYIGKQFVPFSIRNIQEQGKRQQSTAVKAGAVFGLTPAPKEEVRSAAQNMAIEMISKRMPKGPFSPEEVQNQEARRKLGDALRAGKPPQDAIQEAADAGLTTLQIKNQQKKASMDTRLSLFKMLTPDEAQKVYDAGTDEEKNLWKFELEKKATPEIPLLASMREAWNAKHAEELWAPAANPPNTYTVGLQKKTMTNEQYHDFSKLAGELSQKAVAGLKWDTENPTEADKKAMQELIEEARKTAKNHLVHTWAGKEVPLDEEKAAQGVRDAILLRAANHAGQSVPDSLSLQERKDGLSLKEKKEREIAEAAAAAGWLLNRGGDVHELRKLYYQHLVQTIKNPDTRDEHMARFNARLAKAGK